MKLRFVLPAIAGTLAAAVPAAAQTFVIPTPNVRAASTSPYVPNGQAFKQAVLPSPPLTDGKSDEQRGEAERVHTATVQRAQAAHDREMLLLWSSHYHWAERNPETFRMAVDSTARNSAYASGRMAQKDSPFVAVGLAMIAANPLDYDVALEAVSDPAMRDSVSKYQDRFERRLLRVQRQIEGLPIMILASGTVTESVVRGRSVCWQKRSTAGSWHG
jgi:hypothetical protein